ncbi:hypothetical protein ALC62_12434 [Cyphomyrmex costatus]|uniref:C2H2-type domain-containing protein n=1 Tax=Cyphomyrmex costatus TaxID=456900 RepID=A0A151IB77_9HYME|nr:hypothetical protein ALC62_12434 [Cyphomyrmex costatus]
MHISKKQEILCPFRECEKKYSILCSFTSHVSKIHRNCEPAITVKNLENCNTVENSENCSIQEVFAESEESLNNALLEFDDQSNMTVQHEPFKVQYDADVGSKLFIKNVGQFYLKLESKLLLSASTIQYIVTEINNIYGEGQKVARQKLQEFLLAENVSSDKINRIIEEVFNCDLWIQSNNIFNTDYKRKKFYKKHFDYVDPVFIKIKGTQKFFAYVPLQDTLKKFFNDKSLQNVIDLRSQPQHELLKDFTDGKVFRNNTFFKNNAEALQIILYQDGFEIVNPIGSAKKKHKLLAIYMTLGNIPDNFRSHINCIKLVALCKESDFDHKSVYGKVVEDLKIIEETGIEIDKKLIKGCLVFITGDNLGSHGLGGFVENFSTSQYFCRFCHVTKEKFYSNGGSCKMYKSRSIKSYNSALDKIGNKKDFEGIKFNSVFNQLKNYHVCLPGLPPCLGHDIFEGVVAFDLQLYIGYFINNKWFTLKQLNERIENFKYSTEDRQDKPCTITTMNKKIPGGACQIWNFIRLLPLLIEDKIQTTDNEVWLCTLLLSEIVEIICSPIIHTSCLSYLQLIISQYISMREMLFPEVKLRPKHHYMYHYPELILQFGPLMKVWTMRFESKHRFFKRAIRYCLNFINVLKSLSIKHELLQSLVRLGADIRIQTELYEVSTFHIDLYNIDIQKAIQNARLPPLIQQCSRVVVKGTEYKQGYALVLHQDGYRYNIVIGKMCLFLCYEENIYILFEIVENEYIPYINAYKIGGIKSYECHNLHEVLYFKPLHVYTIESMRCIKPSHGFVSHHV